MNTNTIEQSAGWQLEFRQQQHLWAKTTAATAQRSVLLGSNSKTERQRELHRGNRRGNRSIAAPNIDRPISQFNTTKDISTDCRAAFADCSKPVRLWLELFPRSAHKVLPSRASVDAEQPIR